MCLPCNRTGLIALFTLVFLCPIRASASYRRQLLADGVLPDDFDNRIADVLPTFPYILSSGAKSSCQQQSLRDCKKAVTVKTATYVTTQKFKVVLCTCGDGGYTMKSLADNIARIPGYLLRFVTSVTTVPPNGKFSATMYAQTGEMTIYAQTSLRAIIHECGHAQDYARGIRNVGFTSSDTWKQAVKRSTCRATNYGRDSGSIVEEYAEDMMIYTYNKFRGNRYLALNPACLKPELQALETYTRSLSG